MKKAFTLIELLVAVAIVAILVSLVFSTVAGRKAKSVPVRTAPAPAPGLAIGEGWRFTATDGVLAAEVIQVLTNNGFVVAIDGKIVNISRP